MRSSSTQTGSMPIRSINKCWTYAAEEISRAIAYPDESLPDEAGFPGHLPGVRTCEIKWAGKCAAGHGVCDRHESHFDLRPAVPAFVLAGSTGGHRRGRGLQEKRPGDDAFAVWRHPRPS